MPDRTPRRIGLALIAAGAACNPWLAGLVFLEGGRVATLPSFIFVSAIALFLIAGGVWFIFRARTLDARTAWFSLILMFSIPSGVELGLHGFRLLISGGIDRRLNFSCYRDKPWAPELFREQHDMTMSFAEYTGWRTGEYHGRYMNIDADGTRRTVQSSRPAGAFPELYMFGGSTMWGAYVRDSATIPSMIASALARAGKPMHVVNYGEQGFSFTQGVLQLVLLLREGKRPASVLMYEGFNDIGAAEANGRADMAGLVGELNGLIDSRRSGFLRQVGTAAARAIAGDCMMYRSVERLAGALTGNSTIPPGIPVYPGDSLAALASGVAEEFRRDVVFVDSLSRMYGFTWACVLQPGLYTKAHVTEEEMSADRRANDPQLRTLFHEAYARIRRERLPQVFDFTPVFDHQSGTVYIDVCHVSEEGNALLADSLLTVLAHTR